MKAIHTESVQVHLNKVAFVPLCHQRCTVGARWFDAGGFAVCVFFWLSFPGAERYRRGACFSSLAGFHALFSAGWVCLIVEIRRTQSITGIRHDRVEMEFCKLP
ncbi:hypothetical protein O9929_16215 [Vibrio lentus]|nr:hypothetical protein [Vibrio lentus]